MVKCGILTEDSCTVCKQEKETIIHLFWHCERVQPIWLSLSDWLKSKCDKKLELEINKIIFGIENIVENRGVNMCILIVKRYCMFADVNNHYLLFRAF